MTKIYFDSIIYLVTVLQKLVKPANEKTPAGVFYFLGVYVLSEKIDIKPFLSYEDQIAKLREKNLVVKNQEYAIKLLKKHSYFALISGYKKPFKNKDKTYKKNTTVEDIYALYSFDNDLRNLIFSKILQVENNIKSLISYAFSEKYGNSQHEYLNAINYNYTTKNQKGINELITKLQAILEKPNYYGHIQYHKKKYNNVPLWNIIKVLTLGTISKMYSYYPETLQTNICKDLEQISKGQLEKMLAILTLARNVCAHNGRLFNYTYCKSTIDDCVIHEKLQIKKRNDQFVQGKEDLFAIVITFKYLLDKEDFSTFCKDLDSLFLTLKSKTNQIQQPQLFRYMGFPENWREIEGC